MREIAELVLIMVLLFFAALTAASETSIIAVSRIRLRRLAADGSKTARTILKILETPERFFGTILVANNIVDVLIASLVTAIIIRFVGEEGRGVLFATILVSFLIIVSEVAAKTVAARRSEKLSLLLARPMSLLIKALSPIVKILERITNVLTGLIGAGAKGKPSLVTEEEIRALIKIGAEDDVLHGEKYKMLSRIFDFSDTVVKNVMTHKGDIVSISVDDKFDAILDTVLESGYSRLPVYKDTPDNIIGIVNMKDLLSLSCNRELVVLQDIVYPATVVPDSKKVRELLKEFQKGHTHIAIVVDSHDKLAGLVTLEDLLEEIVGEIEDEYDVREKYTNKNTK